MIMKDNSVLRGRVVKGKGRGKSLGYPTINLKPERGNIPPDGVYAVRCWLGKRELCGAASVGSNPTFPDKGFSVEIYLFDFHEEIMGEEIGVCFEKKLREERAFERVDDLVKRMKQDVQEAKEFFKEREKKI